MAIAGRLVLVSGFRLASVGGLRGQGSLKLNNIMAQKQLNRAFLLLFFSLPFLTAPILVAGRTLFLKLSPPVPAACSFCLSRLHLLLRYPSESRLSPPLNAGQSFVHTPSQPQKKSPLMSLIPQLAPTNASTFPSEILTLLNITRLDQLPLPALNTPQSQLRFVSVCLSYPRPRRKETRIPCDP